MVPRRVLVGRVVAAHGVRGLVKIASFTQAPEAIAAYGALEDGAGRPVRLALKGRSGKGGSGDQLLAAVEGVDTRDAAEALRGRELYVPRTALPDPGDEVYVADLEGLEVRDGTGRVLGRVRGVQEFGAGPLLEVEPAEDGETVLIPFTDAMVPLVAPEEGFVVVELPPGLWPGTEANGEAEQG